MISNSSGCSAMFAEGTCIEEAETVEMGVSGLEELERMQEQPNSCQHEMSRKGWNFVGVETIILCTGW